MSFKTQVMNAKAPSTSWPNFTQILANVCSRDPYKNFCEVVLMTRTWEEPDYFYDVFLTMEYYTAIKRTVLTHKVNNALLKLAGE